MASLLSPSAPLLGRDRLHLAYPSASSRRAGLHRLQPIKAFSSADPPKETPAKTTTEATKPPAPSPPKKPVYSMKKGQIVRVDKEKYLSSINVRVLDMRIFETGEYALRDFRLEKEILEISLTMCRRNSIMREYDLGGDLASCINGNKKWKNFAKIHLSALALSRPPRDPRDFHCASSFPPSDLLLTVAIGFQIQRRPQLPQPKK
ncbi:hypothetical protein ZIOFF_024458 [Zingiber officinale]|uniref:Uncharacterized protein n=1 Tax=Zingiber officinale TaxID=94328 RepID=A0A8J5GTL3_ZINOF|nr:hypothetical protein ZIOFF_024458 [Zingiber officinale]